HREKAPPSHIADCLGETAILDHPANVQILDRDHVKTSNQIASNLVVKILATARDLQVRFGDFDSLLRASLRSLLFARKSPLLFLEIVQGGLEMAGVLYFFTVRERGETGDANIYSNSLSCPRQWLRLGRLANNQRIPAVNATCDPKLFALSFNRAGEPNATTADAGNCELVPFDRARSDFLVFLRESVIPVFALESWKSGFLS